VLNIHEAIVNRLLWMLDEYQITSADRILQKTPYSFDVSVWEFFLPLITGATLVMAKPGGHKDPAYLVNLIREQQITTLHFVPSMLTLFLEAEGLEHCRSVRQVFASGEALSLELQSRFFERFHARLHNLYGPTEAAVDVTYWECRPDYARPVVPIGKPVANTQVYILDELLQPVPVGVSGELHIGGIQLARGYLNRTELTAQKFIPNPFRNEPDARLYKTGDLTRFLPDGNIEFLGRIDNQVKLRGFRIELGEIEAVLCECTEVRLAAVTLREDIPGDKRLVAYLVAQARTDLSPDTVRAHLKEKLPEFMLPSRFVVLDEMPMTTSGKIDRNALPRPQNDAGDQRETVAARNDLEAAILPVFRKILGVQSLGVKDDFFEQGGHSLLAARLLAEMKKTTGHQIPLSAMLHAATVESLATLIASGGSSASHSIATPVQRGDRDRIPLFAVVVPGVETLGYAALARHMGAQQPFYTLQKKQPIPNAPPFTRAELEALAQEYIAAMRSIQPEGPYHFIAMCDDVMVAEEMILQLERSGQKVGFFAILDTWPLQNTMVPWKWKIDYYSARLRHAGKLPASDWLRAGREVLDHKLDRKRVRKSSPQSPQDSSTRPTWGQLYWPGPDFQTPRFNAPVVLFKRPHQPFFYVADRKMGWGKRSLGGVKLYEIDLDHENLLREPHIKTIGQTLAARLTQPRSGGM
jgi:thioesterase domain-containing protein